MEEYVVRISNGKNSIYDHRGTLQYHQFQFNKRSYGKSYYERTYCSQKALKTWEAYCKKYRLTYEVIPKEYVRDTQYRQRYFKENEPVVEAKYRCAYCGKQLSYKDATVDHLFPVFKMSHSERVRQKAKRFGINGVNETKNLVCACRSCNSKKGTKMGLWIIRGMIGRHEAFWKVLHVFECAVVLAVIFIGYHLYQSFGENIQIVRQFVDSFRF